MVNIPTVTRLRGLALPAVKGPGGYFESKSPLDVAWGDLLSALMTPRGTRVMNRTFGSVLREQLFEPNTEDQRAIITYVIQEAADEHCPHIVIRNVEAFASNDDPTRVQLRVAFALRTDTANVANREVMVTKTFLSSPEL